MKNKITRVKWRDCSLKERWLKGNDAKARSVCRRQFMQQTLERTDFSCSSGFTSSYGLWWLEQWIILSSPLFQEKHVRRNMSSTLQALFISCSLASSFALPVSLNEVITNANSKTKTTIMRPNLIQELTKSTKELNELGRLNGLMHPLSGASTEVEIMKLMSDDNTMPMNSNSKQPLAMNSNSNPPPAETNPLADAGDKAKMWLDKKNQMVIPFISQQNILNCVKTFK